MTGTMLKEARQLAMHVGGYHKEVMDALVNRLEKWESVFGHLGEPDEVGNEWRALSDRLEAAEKGVALLERLVDARGSSLNAVANECDALRTDKATLQQMTYSLKDRLEAAENENAKLRIALAEKVTSEATLRDLNFGNGFINATFEGGAVQLMVDALADQFVESGAANYIEMQFHSEATGPLLFTLQRVDGKTPHQLRAEAEQERDALRAEVQTWQEQAKAYWSKITEMEKQKPVAKVRIHKAGGNAGLAWSVAPLNDFDSLPLMRDGDRLYAGPGAKGEGK